ncbi:hypothetical protein QE152_g14230 [Popillia japonica]|uniref:Uncharacterized protein n=1 Tax=Popillia japonica TaxID=7064 RepID=A0AAW1L7D1_POPJA
MRCFISKGLKHITLLTTLCLIKVTALCGMKWKGKEAAAKLRVGFIVCFKCLPYTVEHIVCYSDRCGGQNLNKFVASMCLKVVPQVPHLKTIDLKFLVKGHSEMECDSIHAVIATEFKRAGKCAQLPKGTRYQALVNFDDLVNKIQKLNDHYHISNDLKITN